METKANYVRVGIFTLVVLAMAFGFVYWSVLATNSTTRVPLLVRIEGSVTGLQQGSQVQFNGLPVGTVDSLRLDPNNPRVVIASTLVNPGLPISESTEASLVANPLTGYSYIEMRGGEVDKESLLEQAREQGTVPIITASPSEVTDILQTARDVAQRANNIMAQFEAVVETVGPTVEESARNITQITQNVRTFTTSLADNSDNIDAFVARLSELTASANTVAQALPEAIADVQNILSAVDPQQIETIVANITATSQSVRNGAENISAVTEAVQSAAAGVEQIGETIQRNASGIDSFIGNLGPLSQTATRVAEGLSSTVTSANELLASVDPQEVSDAVSGISSTAQNLSVVTQTVADQREAIASAVTGASNLIANLRQVSSTIADRSGEIDATLANLQPISDSLREASGRLVSTVDKAGNFVDRIDTDQINRSIDQISRLASSIGSKSETIDSIIEGTDTAVASLTTALNGFNETRTQIDRVLTAIDPQLVNNAVVNVSSASGNIARAADSVGRVGDIIAQREDEIEGILDNASLTSQRVASASAQLDTVITSVNNLLNGQSGNSLGSQVTATLTSIRDTANALRGQVAPLSANIQSLSDSTRRDIQALTRQLNQTAERVGRAVDNLSNDPSQIIFGGGSEVPTYDGRTRR